MATSIIVGGGIAGCTMAYTLLQQGHKVILIHNSILPAASHVAAGLYNPIVFKRLVPTWLANEVIPYCKQFYTGVEGVTNAQFHYSIPIVKLLTEQQELDLWLKKKQDPSSATWLGKLDNKAVQGTHNKHTGKGIVNQSGWVNVPELLNAYYQYYTTHNNCTVLDEAFNYQALIVTPSNVSYKGNVAHNIIFSEGTYVSNNPYFNHINMKPTKGDVFKINTTLHLNYVLNKGCFMIPYAPNNYIVGSTYNWADTTWEATQEGKAELSTKLNELINVPYTITKHQVGVRPTTHDRRPTLGAHYLHKNVFVFNGLGTKGVLLAPYLAHHLYTHIYNNTELMHEVNVKRYTPKN
jgi:glycine oxidase